MCHFLRIEEKFLWNQNQKVLILIPANYNTQTALPRVKLSTKIAVADCEIICIKLSNIF